ncbi:unnamed protein product [Heligmosomoides polygyrus]|uniref:DUF659 domain-containing protein n=1 Tax=Heligmosomoides polygyrus TaxID=6339 RepID=A0A183GPK4_HELPZ|nr:unnamed protein product [Heligmosomoides polygyrus]
MAYEVGTEWTEFVCVNKGIAKHPPIEGNCIVEFYKAAFEQLKEDLKEESRTIRRVKKGPVGYAATESALLMEKDGPRNELTTRVVMSYSKLLETLTSWRKFSTWILVFPIEKKGDCSIFEEIVKLAKTHLEDGGRIVTAWTPVTAQNFGKWKAMVELWRILDLTFQKFAGPGQFVTTASNMISDGKVFLEVGCPEGTAQFHRAYPGVASAKHLYEAICKRCPHMELPDLFQDLSMRTSTPGRGGVCGKEAKQTRRSSPHGRPPLKRRAQ